MSSHGAGGGGSGGILQVLERQGAISATSRFMLEGFCRRWQVSPFHALLMTEVMEESQLADALAAALGIDRLYHVKGLQPAAAALQIIGFKRAREWEVMAFASESQGADLTVVDLAFADPTQKDRVDALRQELNCRITLAVAERSDIVGAIDELFPLAAQLPSLFGACSR